MLGCSSRVAKRPRVIQPAISKVKTMSTKKTDSAAPAAPAAPAESADTSQAVAELKALVAQLGATQALMVVGQHVGRNATDFETGIRFGRRCLNLAKKVPALG